MRVWAISDLHLSFTAPYAEDGPVFLAKPMDVFGENWHNHFAKIYQNWRQTVKNEDFVLVPGDISWALRLNDAVFDFNYLARLPGKIIISRGNHDYWWQSYKQVQEALPDNVTALQNNALSVGESSVCAVRGWLCPGVKMTEDDKKIYLREVLRLEMCLKAAAAISKDITVMFHFRPVNDKLEKNEFIELMTKYKVRRCLYGHLHGRDAAKVLPARAWDIDFTLVSADYLDFSPRLIWQ